MKRGNGEGSIYKDKRGRWIAALSVGHDSTNGKPIRRTKACRTKRDAIAELDKMRLHYKGGLSVNPDRIKLIDYIVAFVDVYRKPYIRASSFRQYQSNIKSLRQIPLCSASITKLTQTDLQRIIDSLPSDGAKKHCWPIIKTAIKKAVADNILTRDITAGLKPPKVTSKRQISVVDHKTRDKLFDACRPDPPLYIAVKIMYYTGIRIGEAVALCWADIDAKARMATIAHTASGVGHAVTLAPTKTGKTRQVTLPASLVAELEKYRHWQRQHIMLHRDTYSASDYIITYSGKLYDPGALRSRMRCRCRAAGISVRPHELRHTHATELFAAGLTPKDVQERLGHSSIKITMDIYTHYIPTRAIDIADYLERHYI